MDLIARRGSLVVFVEVKTRRSSRFGPAEEAVDARKRKRLIRGAAAWLHENRTRAARVRFDVIACECDALGENWRLRHLEGAFDAAD